MIKEIQKISNEENAKFIFFCNQKSQFLPFDDDKVYKVCVKNREINYSNSYGFNKLNLIFDGIDNKYIYINEINDWYDKFDGHFNSVANENVMFKLSEYLKKN